MHTPSAKQEAIHAIERLPDDVPLDEIVYSLHVLSRIQRGSRDIEAGNTVSSEELIRDIESW